MSGSKRQRDLARAKYERQQARRAASADKRRRNQRIVAIVVVGVLVARALAWVFIGRSLGSGDTTAVEAITGGHHGRIRARPPSPRPRRPACGAVGCRRRVSSEVIDPAIDEPAILDCTAPGTPRANDVSFDAAPTEGNGGQHHLRHQLRRHRRRPRSRGAGHGRQRGLPRRAGLLRQHPVPPPHDRRHLRPAVRRPAGDGTGGPGYTVPDENLPADGEANYPAGTVAMANAGPGTDGSQFFIVYEDTTLPGDYTIWGTVTSGLDIVQEIASVGVEDGGVDGAPRQPVFIESATVQQN